jgi:hypothetical protein
MISFFFPSDEWLGRFGIHYDSLRGFSLTIHLFPRYGWDFWGRDEYDGYYSFQLGPIISIDWSVKPTVFYREWPQEDAAEVSNDGRLDDNQCRT